MELIVIVPEWLSGVIVTKGRLRKNSISVWSQVNNLPNRLGGVTYINGKRWPDNPITFPSATSLGVHPTMNLSIVDLNRRWKLLTVGCTDHFAVSLHLILSALNWVGYLVDIAYRDRILNAVPVDVSIRAASSDRPNMS